MWNIWARSVDTVELKSFQGDDYEAHWPSLRGHHAITYLHRATAEIALCLASRSLYRILSYEQLYKLHDQGNGPIPGFARVHASMSECEGV